MVRYRLDTRLLAICVISSILCIVFTPYYSRAALMDMQNRLIVSLGDSYSSGEGIEPFYGQMLDVSSKVHNQDWLAHRSQESWPGRLSLPSIGNMKNNRGTNWYFVASSGARVIDLYEGQEKVYSQGWYQGTEYIAPQLNVFDELDGRIPDYVTMTLGGNDADFVGILESAVLTPNYCSPNKLSDKLNNVWKEFFRDNGISDRLYQAYNEINNCTNSQSCIIVAGYPLLINSNGDTWFFSSDESNLINQNVHVFNCEIRNIVETCRSEGMNIHFVSVERAFNGHEAYTRDPYINGIIIGPQAQDIDDRLFSTPVSSYSMHPNYDGSCAYAACVQAKINEIEAMSRSDSSYGTSDSTIQTAVTGLTEDQALLALQNYLIDYYGQDFLDDYAPESMGMGLSYLGSGGGVFAFNFATLTGATTIYSIDIDNGVARGTNYDSMDGLSSTYYCFNAYDYLDGYAVDSVALQNDALFANDEEVYSYVMQAIDVNESVYPGSQYCIQSCMVGGYDGDDYLILLIEIPGDTATAYLIDDYGLARIRTPDYYELVTYDVISTYPCLLPVCMYPVQINLSDGSYYGNVIAVSDDGMYIIATVGEGVIVPNDEIEAMQPGDSIQVGTVTIEYDRIDFDYYWGGSPYPDCSMLYSFERGRPYLTNECTCELRVGDAIQFQNTEDPSYFVYDENSYNAYISERGVTGNQFLDSSSWYFIQYEMASQYSYHRGTNHSNGYYLIYAPLDSITVVDNEITEMSFSWH